MKVEFAYPHTDETGSYKPDESADFDEDVARRLINDGKARPAEDPETTTKKKKES